MDIEEARYLVPKDGASPRSVDRLVDATGFREKVLTILSCLAISGSAFCCSHFLDAHCSFSSDLVVGHLFAGGRGRNY